MSRIKQFESYAFKVFKLPDLLESLEDGRSDPDIDIRKVVQGLIYGSALRIKAIAEIERECQEGVLKTRIGPISDDTFGYGLDHVDSIFFHDAWMKIDKIMKRNGMLRENVYEGFVVGVLDGIETLSSYSRSCDRCLERKIEKDGKSLTQYYHRIVVLSLSGFDHPIPLALESMKPKEGEVDCAIRLLERLVGNLGPRFLDVVIGDALFCTPAFFNACKRLGIGAGAVLKDNQHELLQEAQFIKSHSEPVHLQIIKDSEKRMWDLKSVDWATADRDVRVIWTDRKRSVIKEYGKKRTPEVIEKKNVFAFSKDLDQKNAGLLYKIGRNRQHIDSALFQDLTVNCHLKHPALHFPNAYENLLVIRFIAFILMTFFFHRHVNSRRKNLIEAPTLLVKQVYLSMIESDAPS
jgi:hypothetical protein